MTGEGITRNEGITLLNGTLGQSPLIDNIVIYMTHYF